MFVRVDGIFTQVDGMRLVNATPHALNFQARDGGLVVVQPSGYTIPAEIVDEQVGLEDGVEFLATVFKTTARGLQELDEIDDANNPGHDETNNLVVVGSIASARAYPGRVFAPVPVPGFEQEQMRYFSHQFNIFYHPA